ncbi:hypothetical protein Cma02nite_21010 [Cellulomonas marina]|nr:hypothetical protein Cma02nite_21010 [Cellulomonas marina]
MLTLDAGAGVFCAVTHPPNSIARLTPATPTNRFIIVVTVAFLPSPLGAPAMRHVDMAMGTGTAAGTNESTPAPDRLTGGTARDLYVQPASCALANHGVCTPQSGRDACRRAKQVNGFVRHGRFRSVADLG